MFNGTCCTKEKNIMNKKYKLGIIELLDVNSGKLYMGYELKCVYLSSTPV